ncbi:hypothetical protein [Rheinheimera texasensis]|uniref:hypothetical protein n=1 Tax=Rheinheimera texasensis TaxID=306205 RepID=UPI0032B1E8DE
MKYLFASLAIFASSPIFAAQDIHLEKKTEKNIQLTKHIIDLGIASHLGLNEEQYQQLERYLSNDINLYSELNITPLNQENEYEEFMKNYHPENISTHIYKEKLIQKLNEKERIIAEHLKISVSDLRQIIISYYDYKSLIDTLGRQGAQEQIDKSEQLFNPTLCGPVISLNISGFSSAASTVEITFAFESRGLGGSFSSDYATIVDRNGNSQVFQKSRFSSVAFRAPSSVQRSCIPAG